MNPYFQVFLTAAVTLVGGILLFWIKEFVLNPISEIRKTIGEISYVLVFNARNLMNYSGKDLEDAQRHCRELASKLSSQQYAIICRKPAEILELIPTTKKIEESVGELIFLSNIDRCDPPRAIKAYNKIRENLRITISTSADLKVDDER